MVKTNAVAKRKTVMRCDQINRSTRQTAITFKNIAGSSKTSGKLPQRQVIVQPEAPGGIAEMIVPLGKQRREIPHLIAARRDIPRFGNQLHLRKYRAILNSRKQRRILTKLRRSPHDCSEIEAEAINMTSFHPIA